MHLGSKAEKVFTDKEKVKKVRIPLAYHIIPRHSDDKEQQDSRQIKQFQEQAGSFRTKGIPKNNPAGKHDGNQPFG